MDEGSVWLLGIADNLSGYVHAVGIPNKTHAVIVAALVKHWITTVGPPDVLISDNEFRSKEMEKMCRSYSIEHKLTRETVQNDETASTGCRTRFEPSFVGKVDRCCVFCN